MLKRLKRKSKLGLIVLSAALIFALFSGIPAAAADNICTCCGDFTYGTEGGHFAVMGYAGAGEDIVIPADIRTGTGEYRTITAIGEGAFSGLPAVRTLTIPNSVQSVRGGAFSDNPNLAAVTVGSGLTSIFAGAFSNNPALRDILFVGDAPNMGNPVETIFANVHPGFAIFFYAGAYGWKTPYWHSWQTIPVSPGGTFLTEIAVSPAAPTVARGETRQFSAVVRGLGPGMHTPGIQEVTWAVAGNTSGGTAIDSNGLLAVAADETAPSLTVTATSARLPALSGDASVTVASPAPSLAISSASAVPGGEATLEVTLANNPGFAGLPLRISIPEGLRLAKIESGSEVLSFRAGPGDIFDGEPILPARAGHAYIMMWHTANYDKDGVLLRLTFAVDSNAAEGSHPVEITYATAEGSSAPMDIDRAPLDIAVANGGITVSAVILGDVNGDGIVCPHDLVLLAQLLSGHDVAHKVNRAAAKVTAESIASGQIDIRDLVLLARYLAGHGVILGE